jgi:transposase, IS5 family
MRRNVHGQLPLVPQFSEHEHARELAEVGRVLDECPQLDRLVERDLLRGGISADRGRRGLTAQQVLRAAVLKQMRGYSYEELAFHLSDSQAYRAFCRFEVVGPPLKKSTLQENVALLSPATWEKLNEIVVARAKATGIESGKKVRVDCTPVDSNIHAPTDSSLLWDVVRVLGRSLERAGKFVRVAWSDQRRLAKHQYIGIVRAPSAVKRRPLYVQLLKITERLIRSAEKAAKALLAHKSAAAQKLGLRVEGFVASGRRVVDQTHRRVILEESVPAAEKIVSIFETHANILVKSREEVRYGHKICLNVGASGLVLDCVVHDGNPADVTLAVDMIRRHRKRLGNAPEQAVFDGAFASRSNLATLKDLGVRDAVFTKGQGLGVHEMARSTWVYRALRRFRAGVEGCISFLKRCFGLDRCTWKGFASFHAYVQASVLSANLLLLARHRLA